MVEEDGEGTLKNDASRSSTRAPSPGCAVPSRATPAPSSSEMGPAVAAVWIANSLEPCFQIIIIIIFFLKKREWKELV